MKSLKLLGLWALALAVGLSAVGCGGGGGSSSLVGSRADLVYLVVDSSYQGGAMGFIELGFDEGSSAVEPDVIGSLGGDVNVWTYRRGDGPLALVREYSRGGAGDRVLVVDLSGERVDPVERRIPDSLRNMHDLLVVEDRAFAAFFDTFEVGVYPVGEDGMPKFDMPIAQVNLSEDLGLSGRKPHPHRLALWRGSLLVLVQNEEGTWNYDVPGVLLELSSSDLSLLSSLDLGDNPQDLAISGEFAYVTCLGGYSISDDEIWKVDLWRMEVVSSADASPFEGLDLSEIELEARSGTFFLVAGRYGVGYRLYRFGEDLFEGASPDLLAEYPGWVNRIALDSGRKLLWVCHRGSRGDASLDGYDLESGRRRFRFDEARLRGIPYDVSVVR